MQGDTLSPRLPLLLEKKSSVLCVLRGRASVNPIFHRCPVQLPDVIHYWGKEEPDKASAQPQKGRGGLQTGHLDWVGEAFSKHAISGDRVDFSESTALHDPLLSGAPCSSLCICCLSSAWKPTNTQHVDQAEKPEIAIHHTEDKLTL